MCASNPGAAAREIAATDTERPAPLFKAGDKLYIAESTTPVTLGSPYYDTDDPIGAGWVYPLVGTGYDATEKSLSFKPWPPAVHVRPIEYPVFARLVGPSRRPVGTKRAVVLFTAERRGVLVSGAAHDAVIGIEDYWAPLTGGGWQIIDNPF